MDIGKWVKECRAAAGITQTQLGDMLNVTKGNVSAWETNKHEPSYAQMVEIAKAARFVVPLPGFPAPAWPFRSIPPEKYAKIPERLQGQIEERALALVEEWDGEVRKSAPPAAA